MTSTPFIQAVYKYIMFAGAVDADASSLGVTLYQYTASITEHRVLVAIRFMAPPSRKIRSPTAEQCWQHLGMITASK